KSLEAEDEAREAGVVEEGSAVPPAPIPRRLSSRNESSSSGVLSAESVFNGTSPRYVMEEGAAAKGSGPQQFVRSAGGATMDTDSFMEGQNSIEKSASSMGGGRQSVGAGAAPPPGVISALFAPPVSASGPRGPLFEYTEPKADEQVAPGGLAARFRVPRLIEERLELPWMVDPARLPTRPGDPIAATSEVRRLRDKVHELSQLLGSSSSSTSEHSVLKELTAALEQEVAALNEKQMGEVLAWHEQQEEAVAEELGGGNYRPAVFREGQDLAQSLLTWAREQKHMVDDDEYLHLGRNVSPLGPAIGLKIRKQ
ncbi:unnamed protein product, partial [Amoebophrya sp. A25]